MRLCTRVCCVYSFAYFVLPSLSLFNPCVICQVTHAKSAMQSMTIEIDGLERQVRSLQEENKVLREKLGEPASSSLSLSSSKA